MSCTKRMNALHCCIAKTFIFTHLLMIPIQRRVKPFGHNEFISKGGLSIGASLIHQGYGELLFASLESLRNQTQLSFPALLSPLSKRESQDFPVKVSRISILCLTICQFTIPIFVSDTERT